LSPFVYQFDIPRVVFPNRELISADADFDRVAHRRGFDQRHLRFGDQPHIQQSKPERSRSPNRVNRRRLTDFQFVKRHSFRLPGTAARQTHIQRPSGAMLIRPVCRLDSSNLL